MYQELVITSGESSIIPPTFEADTELFVRGYLALFIFYFSGLWSVKISFLLFFRRLGNKVSGQKPHWWFVLPFTLATYLVAIRTIPFDCLTRPFEEIVTNCTDEKAIKYERVMLCINCAMDVLTDFASKSFPPFRR